MTSSKHDREFLDDALDFLRNDGLLEHALAWIASNLSPEDVFPERELREWAKENGFTETEQRA
jgi:hypothetical protein